MASYINNLFSNIKRMAKFLLEENGEDPNLYSIDVDINGLILTRRDGHQINPELLSKIKLAMARLDNIQGENDD